jgi:hypothetical protein
MTPLIREGARWVQTHKRRALVVLLMTTFMMMLLFGSSAGWWREESSAGAGFSGRKFKIVLDAGSTGTRVHVFEFSDGLLLNYPLFTKQDGGLSDFATHPQKCEPGLSQLIQLAQSVVPEDQWRDTEIILMATAGLRLLPESQAEGLMVAAKKILQKSPFRVGEVDIIDGKAEAKYIYMMARFAATDPTRPMAIVDLGGGSVQLAYVAAGPPKNEYERKFIDGKSNMYLNSWLGYGLVAFRMKALQEGREAPHPCVPSWTPQGTKYTYAGEETIVRPRDNHTMEECTQLVKQALGNNDGQCKTQTTHFRAAPMVCGLNDEFIGPVSEIPHWHLFSYIFDLAKEEGLVPEGVHEVSITPRHFMEAAQAHCAGHVQKRADWWQCVDLVYVSVLLTEGFGLSHTSPVKVTKRLMYRDRIELEAAWPLGAALEALEKDEL